MAFEVPALAASFGDDLSDLPAWLPVAVAAQSLVLTAVAAGIGAALAHRVGLHAPLAEAAAGRRPLGPALRPQVAPGVLGGVVGALLLGWALPTLAPDPIRALAASGAFDLPLHVRVLYGGITEEVLMRWGAMSLFVWIAWRLGRRTEEHPSPGVIWVGIAASALLFAAGHLPTAVSLGVPLTPGVLAYVLAGNSAFGLVAGWLYWRRGLEAAVIAHALSHVGAVALSALGTG